MNIQPGQVYNYVAHDDEYIVIKKCNDRVYVTVYDSKKYYNHTISKEFISVFYDYIGEALSEVFREYHEI